MLVFGKRFSRDPEGLVFAGVDSAWYRQTEVAGVIYNYDMMRLLDIITRSQKSIFRVSLRLHSGTQNPRRCAGPGVCLGLHPTPSPSVLATGHRQPRPSSSLDFNLKCLQSKDCRSARTPLPREEILLCNLAVYAFSLVMLFLERLEGEADDCVRGTVDATAGSL